MVFYPCDFEANAEDAKFIYADKFIDYLHELYGEQGVQDRVCVHGDSVARRWFRWRNEIQSGLLPVHSVDEFLIKLYPHDLRINELPCEMFSFADRNNRPRSKTLSKSDRFSFAKRVVEGGESAKDIAAEANRTYSAVAKWTTLYRQGKLAA